MYKRVRRYIAISLSWLLIFNSTAPTLILAEELETITETTTETPAESPAPSIEPSPTPIPSTEPQGEAVTETGDAYATAESTSMVDTTAVESEVTLTSDDIINPDQGDLDLTTPEATESATEIVEPEATESAEITIDNQAKNETHSEASSSTGENNQTTSGDASMNTGDAVASSYATSLTNTTLINSNLQVALLSIFTEWNGNLILDPINIDTEALAAAVNNLRINNEGEVVTVAEATATTGDNTQVAGGDAIMTTGDGMAVAGSYAVVNMTAMNAAIIDLLVQNIWLWSGHVRNMTAPGSVQTPEEAAGRTILASGTCDGCATDLTVKNYSEVTTTAKASASTGGNTQTAGENASMTTGNAMASATAYSMANTTLINSDYRSIAINLLAPWTGDLIFAYPDLELTVEAPSKVKEGETINYLLHINNRGYKVARPIGLITSIGEPETIDEIAPLSGITRTFSLDTNGKGGQEVTFTANASTVGSEESETNNVTSVTTVVEKESEKTEKVENKEVPALTLAATNNVNGFIYAGDSVQYEVKVTNTGSITSHDTKMIQVFLSDKGELIQGVSGKIGDIAINQTVTARFTLSTKSGIPNGEYHTETVALGYSDIGRETSSNTVSNQVSVRSSGKVMSMQVVPQAEANEGGSGDVLGEVVGLNTENECNQCQPWWWYGLVAVSSTAYFALLNKKWALKRLVGNGLGIPLVAYGLFLLTNKECAQGLTFISSNPWCTWFLPVSDGIFAIPSIITWKFLKK